MKFEFSEQTYHDNGFLFEDWIAWAWRCLSSLTVKELLIV